MLGISARDGSTPPAISSLLYSPCQEYRSNPWSAATSRRFCLRSFDAALLVKLKETRSRPEQSGYGSAHSNGVVAFTLLGFLKF